MCLDGFYHFYFLENGILIFENLKDNKKMLPVFPFLFVDNFKII